MDERQPIRESSRKINDVAGSILRRLKNGLPARPPTEFACAAAVTVGAGDGVQL